MSFAQKSDFFLQKNWANLKGLGIAHPKKGEKVYDGMGMLSDFSMFASVSISMIAKARQSGEGISLSVHVLSPFVSPSVIVSVALPCCGVARDHWLYHSSRTVVRKRVASGLVNVVAPFYPLFLPLSTVCPLWSRRLLRPWMLPHQWNNPAFRSPVADGFLISGYRVSLSNEIFFYIFDQLSSVCVCFRHFVDFDYFSGWLD